MNTELQTRLTVLEARLKERGVVDVKFHVDYTKGASGNQLTNEAVDFIEAVLDGKTKPCFGIGDSSNPVTIEYLAAKRREYEALHGPLDERNF